MGERKILVLRVRRLFFMAYQAAAQDTESFLTRPRSGESVQMVPADREGRRTALARRLGHLPLVGRNDPSLALIDFCATILTSGVVRYMAWPKCTYRAQEVSRDQEPPEKAQRTAADGNSKGANRHKDPMVETHTDLLLSQVLSRR